MWLENLQMLTGNINDTRYDDSMPLAGPVRISRASPEQMAIWKKEREERMAKQAEVIADRKAGMSRLEIAEKHGIALTTVDNHLYRAKKAAEAGRMKGAPVEADFPQAAPIEPPPDKTAPAVTPSMYAIPPVPAALPSKSSLRPTAYAGDYAVYSTREGCVIMDDLPNADLDMLSAEHLRMFAAEMIEMAGLLEAQT